MREETDALPKLKLYCARACRKKDALVGVGTYDLRQAFVALLCRTFETVAIEIMIEGNVCSVLA